MRITAALAAFVCAAACIAPASGCARDSAAAGADGPDAATLGDAGAPVTIIEYASTTCHFCAEFDATLFPHVKAAWIDTGQARLIMRPLPTQPAELSVAGSLLARCAGTGRYFDVLHELFATQDALFTAAQAGGAQSYYEAVGGRHGVTPAELKTCLADEAGIAQINAAIEAAAADGVQGTPSFLIDGRLYAYGQLHDTAAWDAAIQAALDAK